MPGLANFIIDHINRGIAGDVAGQVQSGQMSPADAGAAYTQGTGLPAGDLFAGTQQSALAKLASDPSFASMAPQDQLTALAKLGSLGVIPAMQEMAVNRAYGQALGGGGPSAGRQNGSVGYAQPTAPAPQTLPGQASAAPPASPLSGLAGILSQGLNPAPVMNMVKTQADLGKTAADTAQAASAVPKNQAEATLAQQNAAKAVWEMGGSPAAGVTAATATTNPLTLYTRIQAAENASGDPKATGDGGKAVGLMQTHPAAFAEGAEYAGLKDPDLDNPAHQMLAGQGYLQKQLDTFKDPVKAAIAYNAGPSVAQNWDGNVQSLPSQTQTYLGKVFGTTEAPAGLGGKAAQDVVKAGATKTAETNAENLGEAQKTYNVMNANFPNMVQRIQDMSDANKVASFQPIANDKEGDGLITAYEDSKLGDPKIAAANAMLQQRAAQGVLPELGPALSQAGIKGNKFLETLANQANNIDLSKGQVGRQTQIDGLMKAYLQNMKSQHDQITGYGGTPSPLPAPAVAQAVKYGVMTRDEARKYLNDNHGMPIQ